MRKHFAVKNIVLILFIFAFVTVFIITGFANNYLFISKQTLENNIRGRLMNASRNAAMLVTAEELDVYQDVDDMAQQSYRDLRSMLLDFSLEYDLKYVYYIRPMGDYLQYIVDNDFNEETRVGLDTPPHSAHDVPGITEALMGQTSCSSLFNYAPGWEGLISSYSPVFNQKGEITAIAGVDIDDHLVVRAWRMVQFLTVVQVVMVTMVFLCGLLGLVRFHREAKKAMTANTAKSNFLSRMSHEIRTPLNAIIGMSELALYAESESKIADYLDGINHAGHNLLVLINEILDFSRIESGSMHIASSPYYLTSVLNDVVNVMKIRLTGKPILFTVDVDVELPARILGDETRIRQILLNLLSNAIKFTKEGSINLRIGTDTGCEKKDKIPLVFVVTDTGMGIKKEDLSKLFGDFVRLDLAANNKIEGTGLGLAISRSLCRSMGGDIIVSSEYGQGSVFTATVLQGWIGGDKLAVVENPGDKTVLLYDHRTAYADTLLTMLHNLQVPVTACVDTNDFLEALSGGSYGFAFVSSQILEQVRTVVHEQSLATILVLLADMEEKTTADGNIRVVPMPAFPSSLANILNGREYVLNSRKKAGVNFFIPDAQLLVVDDIPANLAVAQGLIASYGAQIDTCSSGAEALELIKNQRYDLVFMDHMMPEMDGIETVKRIRQWEKEKLANKSSPLLPEAPIPIVALTANAISGMQEMFLSQGFNDFLSKPIELYKLDQIMRTWIDPELQQSKR